MVNVWGKNSHRKFHMNVLDPIFPSWHTYSGRSFLASDCSTNTSTSQLWIITLHTHMMITWTRLILLKRCRDEEVYKISVTLWCTSLIYGQNRVRLGESLPTTVTDFFTGNFPNTSHTWVPSRLNAMWLKLKLNKNLKPNVRIFLVTRMLICPLFQSVFTSKGKVAWKIEPWNANEQMSKFIMRNEN